MTIAVISDIHGNIPALEAVIDDLRAQQVDEILVCGDLVGRGPQGHAVIRRIVDLGWPCLKGNHEDFLERIRQARLRETDLAPSTWPALQWMAADLTAEDDAFIAALPLTLTSASDPRVRLFHGTPSSFSRGIGPWTPNSEFSRCWEAVEETVLVVAHTHRTLQRSVASGLVVNVGSVGLPFNGDTRAQYAIIGEHRDEWEVTFRRVEYDQEAFLKVFETTGFLSAGGSYSALLRREVETARSHLVPYMKWCELTKREFTPASLELFLSELIPGESQAAFFERIRVTQKNDDGV